MRVHFCQHNGCHETIPISHRYCKQHASEYKPFGQVSDTQRKALDKAYNYAERDQAANAFYHSARWTKVRNFVATRDMYTDAVTGLVIPDKQLQVDHIIPMRLCKDPFNLDNLWCLSRKNHTRKNKVESGMSDNQLKHVSREWWIKVLKERTR